jgi:hypothetical protein
MADIKKTVQKSNNDDFRRMETHVEEVVQGAATERVTTVKEEVIPMMVKKVVREKIVPVVASRIIESYDESGKVVDTQHEVVHDEAMALKGYERDAIAKTVEDAIRRAQAQRLDDEYPHVEEEPDEPVTLKPSRPAKKSAMKIIEERNEPKKGIEFEFDGSILLYSVIAIEAAVILYMTVLKGWLLN